MSGLFNFIPFINRQPTDEGAGPSSLPPLASPGRGRRSTGIGSPIKASSPLKPRGGPSGLVVPHVIRPPSEDLLADNQGLGGNADVLNGSPAAREIRSRPIDQEKELPIIFSDEGDGLFPAPAEPSSSGLALGATRHGSSASLSGLSVHGACPSPGPKERLDSALGYEEVVVPMFERDAPAQPAPAAKRYRRSNALIKFRPAPSIDSVAEYELDHDDEAWLTNFNQGLRQPLIDADQLEELMDQLEKASFRALHAHALVGAPPPAARAGTHPRPSPLGCRTLLALRA